MSLSRGSGFNVGDKLGCMLRRTDHRFKPQTAQFLPVLSDVLAPRQPSAAFGSSRGLSSSSWVT